jgi:hypothetical protein
LHVEAAAVSKLRQTCCVAVFLGSPLMVTAGTPLAVPTAKLVHCAAFTVMAVTLAMHAFPSATVDDKKARYVIKAASACMIMVTTQFH